MNNSPTIELHQLAAIGRLLTGIVHEINSPLASVLSNNEVLRHSLEMVADLLADPSPESLEKARHIVNTCRTLAAVDNIACGRIRSVIRGLKVFQGWTPTNGGASI